MKTRREFLKASALTGIAAALNPSVSPLAAAETANSINDRTYWLSVMERLASPILENLARGELKQRMPVEAANPNDRSRYTHLEAVGRLLVGIAPWLEVDGLSGREAERQQHFLELTRRGLANAVNPESPDFLNFRRGGQALVDSAFLAEAILRAPKALWVGLSDSVRQQVVAALRSSRAIGTPDGSNWVMFAAMVEAFLLKAGETTLEGRLEACVEKMLSWYKGDGAYGDGPNFHWDYYNAFVIQPMLIDVLLVLREKDKAFDPTYQAVLRRSRRYAAVQERLIAPDGSFPPLGRSLAYRFGAFQSLAQMSLMRELPAPIKPAQVRCAMTLMIRRLTEAPGTFDANGWLRLGLHGHQPGLAEGYISTGSLYLCSVGLLPLGLPSQDEFWSAPAAKWTSQKIWDGEDVPVDKAMDEPRPPSLPRLQRGE